MAFLHLSDCGQNRGVKGTRPSFAFRFVAKAEKRKEHDLPSLFIFSPQSRSERSAAFLHLRICGPNRGMKGAQLSSTSRFVAKTDEVNGARPSFTF